MLRDSNRVLVFALTLGLASACETSKPATTPPESVDGMTLHGSYGELMVAMLMALRTGDLGVAKASIATAGQVESMCPGYIVPVTPYAPHDLASASGHCREVFEPIPADALQASLDSHTYGRTHVPAPDSLFQAGWRDQCPADFEVFEIPGIFEVRGEGLPDAGFEVSDVFRYRGGWGLMTIPRCRGTDE